MVRPVLVFAVVVTASSLLACGTGTGTGIRFGPRGACGPADEAVTRELKADTVLDLAPPGATAGELYAVPPCDDEDGTGEVGRQLSTSAQDEAVLAFYGAELPDRGWEPARGQKAAPDAMNGDGPHQCYENPARPGVALVLYLGLGENPATDLHLTFRFKADTSGGYGCADDYRP